MDLTVVIPTRDRVTALRENLARLEAQSREAAFEVVVVDDGSSDGTAAAVRQAAATSDVPIALLEQAGLGAAAARNRALATARAPVCLFINDDTLPRPELVRRHARFHADNPDPEDALLGRIELATDPRPTPFMRWLATVHFGQDVEDPHDAGGRRFFTSNVSVKAELVRRAGGFDEAFPAAGHEDIDLGLRLEREGLRLAHDPEAVVEHRHPLDLPGAIERFRGTAASLVLFTERHPDWPPPTRPGARHRAKAGALTALTALGLGRGPLRRETWRFLCDEATREGYWDAIARAGHDPPARGVRIGATLARLASRDRDTRLPAH
jgi:glycosyltransferase involved in cell wall biosynthesis